VLLDLAATGNELVASPVVNRPISTAYRELGMQNGPKSSDPYPLERFSQLSMSVILHARAEVTAAGARSIQANHLLIGILRGTPLLVEPLLAGDWTTDRLVAAVTQRDAKATPIPEDKGVPMSAEGERVLIRAVAIADDAGAKSVEPVHILAAFMADESSSFAKLLVSAGVERQRVLEQVRRR
jgi:ATP-dependent Clp protease ATP-binding subunit ClpA